MKKIAALALFALAATGLSGCFSFVDMEHNENHFTVWDQQLDDAHRSIDRFFFDYDWDDPSNGVESYRGR